MDEGNLIILFNAFQKKSQKTPKAEIEKAKRIMNEYYEQKKTNDMIMDKKDTKKLQLTPVEDMITEDFGKEGTSSRMEFEAGVDAFILGEKLKEERIKAGLTQEQLAARIGTKKTYISRVENGHADIQMSTLFKIFHGLGRKVSFTIL